MSNFSTPDTSLVRIYNISTLKMKNNSNSQFFNKYSFPPPTASCLCPLVDSRGKFSVSFMVRPAEKLPPSFGS